MISFDTNVLVRLFVADSQNDAQSKLAKEQVLIAREIYITKIVQVELVWVLKSSYKFDKKGIITILETIQESFLFRLEDEDSFAEALASFKLANADFSDYLILAETRKQELNLVTFDRKLGKSENVVLLKPPADQ